MRRSRKGEKWFSTPNEARKRHEIKLTLAPEERAKLDALAERLALSRSRVVSWLLEMVD